MCRADLPRRPPRLRARRHRACIYVCGAFLPADLATRFFCRRGVGLWKGPMEGPDGWAVRWGRGGRERGDSRSTQAWHLRGARKKLARNFANRTTAKNARTEVTATFVARAYLRPSPPHHPHHPPTHPPNP
jgi:hypothetical protein